MASNDANERPSLGPLVAFVVVVVFLIVAGWVALRQAQQHSGTNALATDPQSVSPTAP
jgi:hypothetical protein